MQRFWEIEDDTDLRDVTIEWLTPVDCVSGLRKSEEELIAAHFADRE